jgi:hypothetical protein
MLRSCLACLTGLIATACFSQPFPSQSKLAHTFNEIETRGVVDSIMVSISFKGEAPPLKLKFVSVYSHHRSVLIGKIRKADIERLIADENVTFVSPVFTAKEELTTGAFDLTLNKINYVHARMPMITGDSLLISVKERRFDTSDIDLKGRIVRSGVEAADQTAHASLMTTIIAGGANSSPFAKGAAWKANVTSASFAVLLPDHDSIFQKYKISVQNHSYGTIVENFYGNEARAYDLQMNTLPTLLHVFSAGNSGNVTTTSGPYAGVPQFANLTGNFKQSKNSISVRSTDSSGQIMPLSSKGPAYDGRIKPELVAYGEDGSSGAAATASGAALLVQHTYRRLNGGNVPNSSLVKAALLNSADDLGNPNVDFISGFGRLNAYKAVTTIQQQRYFESSVAQTELKSFNVAVPAGISKLKLVLAWNDPAAGPNASKALMNDLDVVVRLPSTNDSWLPWVLDHSPNAVSLQSSAQRKVDTLNNVEQITIDHPVAGNYIIEVKGTKVANGSQNFSLVYQLDTADVFYWSYPTFNDPLISKNVHWLRWETNYSGSGQIEYATSGNNWRLIGNVSDLSIKYFRWQLPDTITTAVLRMRIPSNGITVFSDTFTISPQLNMNVGFNCADSFLLYWNRVPPNNYAVYELTDKYLQQFNQRSDTSIILNKQQRPSIYYTVAPVINGKQGIKANTINYPSSAPSCYITSFFLQSQTSSSANFFAELGTLFHVAEVSFEKLKLSGNIQVQTINNPTSAIFNFTDPNLNQGENRYRIRVRLANGTVLYSNVEIVYHLPASPVVIYPNPSVQYTTLNIISNESGRYTVQFFDVNGRMVYSQFITNTLTRINSGFFAKGLYVVRIIDKLGKTSSQKLVIY